MDTIENTRQGAACPILHDAGSVTNEAQESTPTLKNEVSELVSNTGEKADQLAASAGRGLEALAEGIRQHAPSDGILGDASNQLASTLHSSGRYLEEHGVTEMADEVTEIIRRNPIPAIFVALGIGFVLARATSVRSF